MVLLPFLMYQVLVAVVSILVFSLVRSRKELVSRAVLSGVPSVLDVVILVAILAPSTSMTATLLCYLTHLIWF